MSNLINEAPKPNGLPDVSQWAKNFQEQTSTEIKEKVYECAQWFTELVGYFGHYAFFTEKLWRKIEGFETTDEAEVICAFIQMWFRYRYGWQDMPVGCAWTRSTPTVYTEEDALFSEYIKQFQPVFIAFQNWKIKQR